MTEATSLEQELYPQECPFCRVSKAYPADKFAASENTHSLSTWIPSNSDADADASRIDPNCHLVLNAPDVLAFLDIMPLTPGHTLLITRSHRVKLGDVPLEESKELGLWLPLLSKAVVKAVGATDWNVVQNNGPRAAQVVPHVHFHIIPRPKSTSSIENRSWTMFGRGQRDDLDDEEGEKMASKIRDSLKQVILASENKSSI